MRDVNYVLRSAYISALTGLELNDVAVPVYYLEAPDNITAKNYIVITSVSNGDESTKSTDDTQTSISLTIYTHNEKYNSGKDCDDIASLVLQAITSGITVSGMQVLSTKVQSDNTQTFSVEGQRKYVDRTITFSHEIFQQ